MNNLTSMIKGTGGFFKSSFQLFLAPKGPLHVRGCQEIIKKEIKSGYVWDLHTYMYLFGRVFVNSIYR